MRFSGPLQNLLRGAVILLLVMVVGTIGYRLIEQWSLIDSLYMTVTTVFTVGYSEVHPLSTAGRLFSIALILGGVGTVFYIATSLVQYILEGEFGFRLGRRRMEEKIRKLHNHFIICGYGRVGESIANTLNKQDAEFVVIEQREDCANRARQAGFLTIMDDATQTNVLRKANIDKARALITAVGDDADNVYTTLAARELHPTLPIIARASKEDARKKLQQAGAHRVVAPETIGGQRMAGLALRPETVEFVETILFSPEKQLLVEEIEAGQDSQLVGSTILEVEERFPGIAILALKKEDGTLIARPRHDTPVPKSASLVAFGTAEQLHAIEECCTPKTKNHSQSS